MADNFEDLGIDIKVNGGDSAISVLDGIIKRIGTLEKSISRLSRKTSHLSGRSKKTTIGNGSKEGFEHYSKTGKLTKEERKHAKASGNYASYHQMQKELALQTQLGHRYAETIAGIHELNKATQSKLSYSAIANNQDLISAKTQAEIARLTAQTAVSNELLANSEWQLALAEQATLQYNKQQISTMARLKAEQEALTNGKWEEMQTIKLANEQRKKEITQRLEQQLGINKTGNSLKSLIAKMTSLVVIARQVGNFISGAIKESADYIENLNLFAVAYGDVYKETIDWALDLASGFGLANNEVVKFAGTFRQLSTSLGIAKETAGELSQVVTNLGYDFSALFNTSVEDAMDKLQSSIFSGNVRPLRAYGIDISQTQIDALFETNETLASLGVNARNLTQADKVLARLIITMQSGSNAFGTMNREINTLQSQIRILQGSFANFKLAIGDLVYEPVRGALVAINAFIIAATNIIRVFAPLKKTDENNLIDGTTMSAEEATGALDELNGRLADFDKFNVLGSQSGGNESSLVTEALTKELEKQTQAYKDQLKVFEDIQNQAVELAGALEPVVIAMTAIAIAWTVEKIRTTKSFLAAIKVGIENISGGIVKLNKGISWTNTLLIGGIIYAVVLAIQAFQDGEYWAGTLAIAIGVALVGAWIYLNREMIRTVGINIGKFFASLFTSVQKLNGGFVLLGFSLTSLIVGLTLFISEFSNMSKVERSISIFGALAAAITAVAIAFHATHNWAKALMVGGIVAGGVLTVAGTISKINGFADGGYTNANLIMTHENGKREWVGKAAGSSAIVNDTQMSDIMEGAVAKGVYNALMARSALNGGGSTNETIVIKIGEQEVFNAVRRTAKQQGKDFANI